MRSVDRAALVAAIVLTAGAAAYAEEASVTLDGKKTTVNYTAAAVKGQQVALGQFHNDADIVFKGVSVPKGNYSLYAVPGADKWVLIINKGTGAKYDQKLDVGRVNMTVAKAAAPAQTLKVSLTKSAALAAKLQVEWQDTAATAQFHLDRVAGSSEW